MIDIDKWQEIFSSLSRHKLRTVLTALSVWWGIFMLVILLGAGNGLFNSANRDFTNDATNTLWVWGDRTSKPYKGLPAGRRVEFDNDDTNAVDRLDGTDRTSARFRMSGDYFIAYKNKSLAYDVQCVRPEHYYIENPILMEGRFVNQTDIEKQRKVVSIGEAVKNEFFEEGESPLGEYLSIKGVKYQIVGVFTEERSRETERVYIPIATAQRIEGSKRVHTMVIDMGEATPEEALVIENNVRRKLANRLKVDPSDRQAVGIYNSTEQFKEIQTVMLLINIFIWFVGIGSIIAGVIGVSNIMLIIVKERTKEIGVRKALGATPGSIISMIVQESVFLTSIAGYLGLACGMALIYAIQKVMEVNEIELEFFYNPEVDVKLVLIALLILIVSGAVAGLIPAIQAARINPVVAMKS